MLASAPVLYSHKELMTSLICFSPNNMILFSVCVFFFHGWALKSTHYSRFWQCTRLKYPIKFPARRKFLHVIVTLISTKYVPLKTNTIRITILESGGLTFNQVLGYDLLQHILTNQGAHYKIWVLGLPVFICDWLTSLCSFQSSGENC